MRRWLSQDPHDIASAAIYFHVLCYYAIFYVKLLGLHASTEWGLDMTR